MGGKVLIFKLLKCTNIVLSVEFLAELTIWIRTEAGVRQQVDITEGKNI